MSETIPKSIDITVADSWVRATKLKDTTGSGEKKLYIGGDANNRISSFFGDVEVTAFINSDEVLGYLTQKSSEFMQNQSKYRKGEKLKKIYLEKVRALSQYGDNEEIEFTLVKQDVTGDRYYVSSEDDIFDHLRDILIPEETILRITKTDGIVPRFQFTILDINEIGSSQIEEEISREEQSCMNMISDVWERLEEDITVLDAYHSPFGIITYFRQHDHEGLYLGLDNDNRRMMLRRVVSDNEARYFGDLVAGLLHEKALTELEGILVFDKYEHEDAIFGVIYLLDQSCNNSFNQLICQLISDEIQIDGFFHSRSKLSQYHKRYNNQPSSTTHKEFHNNPDVYRDYHLSYRVSRTGHLTTHEYLLGFLLRFHNDSPKLIADFGCGEAKLAQYLERDDLRDTEGSLIDHRVINIDHFDFSKFRDLKDPVPEKIKIHEVDYSDGSDIDAIFSEYSEEEKCLDIAIFSLSLWGQQPNPFHDRSAITLGLLNAHKHLKPDGEIHIIESSSRLGISKEDLIGEEIEDETSPLHQLLRRLKEIGFTINNDKILELNNQPSSLYKASNHRFIHIIGKKDRYNLRLRNNITEIGSVFDSKTEEELH